MPSVVQTCNMALSHIGSEARVASINPPDGSVEAGYCATFYDMARTELLETGNWAFALKREALAQTANLSETWTYAYAKPSTCQRPLRILRPGTTVTVFNQDTISNYTNDSDSAPFEVEGEVIYTNQPDAVLVFTTDIVDTNKFPASFTSSLSFLLGSYLAGPILKGTEGMRVGDAMRERAYKIGDVSATASANASSSDNPPTASVVSVRA